MSRPDRVPMTRAEITALIHIEPVLRRLGLSLYCLRCHGRGQKDGVPRRQLSHRHRVRVGVRMLYPDLPPRNRRDASRNRLSWGLPCIQPDRLAPSLPCQTTHDRHSVRL